VPHAVTFNTEQVPRESPARVAIPEIRSFIANPWDHLLSGTDGQSGPDSQRRFIQSLSFSPAWESTEADLDTPQPLRFTVFYSSVAFPISHIQIGVAELVDEFAGRDFQLTDIISAVARFIEPELCPIRPRDVLFERWMGTKRQKRWSKSASECIAVTYGGSLLVGRDEVSGVPELTKSGFCIKNQFAFETDRTMAEAVIAILKNGVSFGDILKKLSAKGDLADALTAPNLILPLVLLNFPKFPLSLVAVVFRHITQKYLHHFLVRSLFLAEISHRRLPMMFQPGTPFGKPLLILFCSWALDWAVTLLERIASRHVLDPIRVLKNLLRECDHLPPQGMYILRVMFILSLFAMGDIRSTFELFLRFISLVIREVTRAKGLTQNGAATMISQLVVRLENHTSENKSLQMFTSFLERVLLRVPDMEVADYVDLDPVQEFISENVAEVNANIRKFMDQPPDQHILVFSFAQNFRFLANMQKTDRTRWIPHLLS
jgi:hypothetical protein